MEYAGNTGYGGTYVQLMKYTYDCNTVSVAQASGLFTAPWYGTPDESKFTRIGGPVFRVLPPVQLSDFNTTGMLKLSYRHPSMQGGHTCRLQ